MSIVNTPTLFEMRLVPSFNGLPADIFNSEWRAVSSVERCAITDVDDFIEAHYLKKRPGVVVLCLRMLVRGQSVGTAVYALPPQEINKRYGGKTWELARLYLLDEVPRNAETWLIGQTVKYIKKHYPDVDYLLSYADPSAGHAGTIYKAANWLQDGRTDQERKSPRNDYVDERTGKKYSRRSHVPSEAIVARVPRVSKWRFVLSLRKEHA